MLLARGECGANGVLDHPVAGLYEAEFDVGGYYRAQGIEIPDPAFTETATFRFGVAAVEQH